MLPPILAEVIEDEVLAKAFCITVMVRMPGTRKVIKGTPMTSPRVGPIAIVKIINSSPALINGAMMVCDQTFIKRFTSRSISVATPIQLTRPNLRTPIDCCDIAIPIQNALRVVVSGPAMLRIGDRWIKQGPMCETSRLSS